MAAFTDGQPYYNTLSTNIRNLEEKGRELDRLRKDQYFP